MSDKDEKKVLFGRRLKAERALKGIERKDLADSLGVHNSSLSYYENGINYPTVDVLIKIADILGVSIDYLLGRSEDK